MWKPPINLPPSEKVIAALTEFPRPFLGAQKTIETKGSHILVPRPSIRGIPDTWFVGSLCVCGLFGPYFRNACFRLKGCASLRIHLSQQVGCAGAVATCVFCAWLGSLTPGFGLSNAKQGRQLFQFQLKSSHVFPFIEAKNPVGCA